MEEAALTQKLIGYNTSKPDGLRSGFGFVKGWLESEGIEVSDYEIGGLPILACEVGCGDRRLILHGHLDVVPGYKEQFEAKLDGDRIIGRGAYDMKGAVAGMLCAINEPKDSRGCRVAFLLVPDEESEETDNKASSYLVEQGYVGDFCITGEPTQLHIGVQAKGVLAVRLLVSGRSAHGSTPWLGDNAILKAVDIFEKVKQLPFTAASSELFEGPSVNLGRILGGDALNKVPDICAIDLDIRFVPGQEPDEILAQIEELADLEIGPSFVRQPAVVDPANEYVQCLQQAAAPYCGQDSLSVGRDGTSDAVMFIAAGMPAVEFGPCGGGHHGPEEWVSASSLVSFRKALVDFARAIE